MKIDYEGRTVVVTGGTGALGHAVVELLLESDARVVVPALNDDEAQRTRFGGNDGVSIVVSGSLADEANAERFYQRVDGLWASVQIAGGFAMSPLAETSLDDFRRMMQMNAESCFLCCREAVKRMRANRDAVVGARGQRLTGGDDRELASGNDESALARGSGRLVNVAARPALSPVGGMLAYSTSKAAVAAITQSLAQELLGERLWVNAIVPSIIDTPANRMAMPKADHSLWPRPDEIARAVVFLASPQNATTSGALVPVYGAA
ncbi:MAG: SDR family NAD(P)-dependent oxidoreductase [Myxococcales bacterium]|nr:SDR family NAD(P)-dependent oxidoreductase [Myxococcales bacterium]